MVRFSIIIVPSIIIGFCGTIRSQGEDTDDSSVLVDFRSVSDLNEWSEVSDTVRKPGKSKAAFVLQKSQLFQRAVFFTLLNPQPNGAGFAGCSRTVKWDLSPYSKLRIRLRGQGQNYNYKISLRHKGENEEPHPAYEQFFTAPMNDFEENDLPLGDFAPYYRGKRLDPTEAESLDLSNITSFNFQIYGGIYSDIKQSGVSSLEIDWVKAL